MYAKTARRIGRKKFRADVDMELRQAYYLIETAAKRGKRSLSVSYKRRLWPWVMPVLIERSFDVLTTSRLLGTATIAW